MPRCTAPRLITQLPLRTSHREAPGALANTCSHVRSPSQVRPTEHPRLDPFCSELTGIGQPQVDRAPLLAEALPSFEAWLCGLGVPLGGCVAASWTSWDLEVGRDLRA